MDEIVPPDNFTDYRFDEWVEVDLDEPLESIIKFFAYCLDVPELWLKILFSQNIQPTNYDTFDVESVIILRDTLKRMGPKFSVLVEHQYVDPTYSDMFSMHIASKHVPYSRFCKRLSFFMHDANDEWFSKSDKHEILQKSFIGSMVIRPISKGKIGHTLLDPSKMNLPLSWVRTSKYTLYVHGVALNVQAFPFSMQDTETMTCAETVTNNLLEYFSNHFAEYRSMLPSEITRLAHHNGYERSLPSRGLRMDVLSKILLEAGFSPRVFTTKTQPRALQLAYQHGSPSDEIDPISIDSHVRAERLRRFQNVMHFFVQSGLPVIVAMGISDQESGHVLICFGHGAAIPESKLSSRKKAALNYSVDERHFLLDDADLYEHYVVMDDVQSPYAWRRFPDLCHAAGGQPLSMLVPLHKHMVIEAIDAKRLVMISIQAHDTSIFPLLEKWGMSSGTADNPLILRFFLVASGSFRAHKVKHPQSELVQSAYKEAIFPKFVFVCEIYDEEGYYKSGDSADSLGEIVLDGSSLKQTTVKSVLLLNYPYFIQYHLPTTKDQILRITDESVAKCRNFPWAPAKGFSCNLFCTKTASGNL